MLTNDARLEREFALDAGSEDQPVLERCGKIHETE
jgi:hypothetical protein